MSRSQSPGSQGTRKHTIAIFQKFLNLTYQLKTQFSQLPNGQISKFQCPSDAEFPEFSENGLTFDPSPFFLLGVMVKKRGTLCLGHFVCHQST